LEYTIVDSRDAGELSQRVSELLRAGWELHGPLHVTAFPHEDVDIGDFRAFTQALIRHNREA
jgi:hypothetical protein